MKLTHLAESQAVLSKCGRPYMPGGVTAVPIPKGFIMPMSIASTGNPVPTTFIKEITGDAPWELRAISVDQKSLYAAAGHAGRIRVQIQLPNGRFLFGGNGIEIGQLAWVGSYRWAQDPPFRFEPGDKILVTLTLTTPVSGIDDESIPVNLLFDGAYLYFTQNGEKPPAVDLASLPRYQRTPNQNIMAPPWMSGQGINTPAGFRDDYMIYSSRDPLAAIATNLAGTADALTTWVVTADVVVSGPNSIEVQIAPGGEFFVRRMLFDIGFQYASSLTPVRGRVLGKLRTGAGFQLNNSKIDLARYLCGAEYPGWWKVQGGDTVYADVELADAEGSGNVTCQIHLEGFQRRTS